MYFKIKGQSCDPITTFGGCGGGVRFEDTPPQPLSLPGVAQDETPPLPENSQSAGRPKPGGLPEQGERERVGCGCREAPLKRSQVTLTVPPVYSPCSCVWLPGREW